VTTEPRVWRCAGDTLIQPLLEPAGSEAEATGENKGESEEVKKKKGKKKKKKTAKNRPAQRTYAVASHPALDYLMQWNDSRDTWKFQKVRQVSISYLSFSLSTVQLYLLKNIYALDRIPKPHFRVLLKYIEDLKGHLREETLKEAQGMSACSPHCR
jgi:hypothetical protein